jgi:hypothetical protein
MRTQERLVEATFLARPQCWGRPPQIWSYEYQAASCGEPAVACTAAARAAGGRPPAPPVSPAQLTKNEWAAGPIFVFPKLMDPFLFSVATMCSFKCRSSLMVAVWPLLQLREFIFSDVFLWIRIRTARIRTWWPRMDPDPGQRWLQCPKLLLCQTFTIHEQH